MYNVKHRTNQSKLAEAGFFYSPTSDSPDNAICFLCQSNLDGWESDDSPATEHLKLAPHCGWAINVCIEKSIQPGTGEDEAPNSARMSDARKMTFGSRWPHEAKRGWVCKTQKVINPLMTNLLLLTDIGRWLMLDGTIAPQTKATI